MQKVFSCKSISDSSIPFTRRIEWPLARVERNVIQYFNLLLKASFQCLIVFLDARAYWTVNFVFNALPSGHCKNKIEQGCIQSTHVELRK